VNPLLRSYGPWGSGAHVSYPYGGLIDDDLWLLPDRAQLFDAKGNVREKVARERDAPAGFALDVLAAFEREPELIDVVALHLLDRHFAAGLHEEILEAVGLELGTPAATRRRDTGFRAAVLEAYLAECCVCGFSLRLVDGLIGVDAAHIRWHAMADRTTCRTAWRFTPHTIACSTTGPLQCARTYGCETTARERNG
jgi:putative restriction endonuclease